MLVLSLKPLKKLTGTGKQAGRRTHMTTYWVRLTLWLKNSAKLHLPQLYVITLWKVNSHIKNLSSSYNFLRLSSFLRSSFILNTFIKQRATAPKNVVRSGLVVLCGFWRCDKTHTNSQTCRDFVITVACQTAVVKTGFDLAYKISIIKYQLISVWLAALCLSVLCVSRLFISLQDQRSTGCD